MGEPQNRKQWWEYREPEFLVQTELCNHGKGSKRLNKIKILALRDIIWAKVLGLLVAAWDSVSPLSP